MSTSKCNSQQSYPRCSVTKHKSRSKQIRTCPKRMQKRSLVILHNKTKQNKRQTLTCSHWSTTCSLCWLYFGKHGWHKPAAHEFTEHFVRTRFLHTEHLRWGYSVFLVAGIEVISCHSLSVLEELSSESFEPSHISTAVSITSLCEHFGPPSASARCNTYVLYSDAWSSH